MNGLIAKYRSWRAYRNAYNQLMDLSDRQLADIALARGTIRESLRQARSRNAGA
jgi:uncharacterized protein YjiS (DUF1127 family)